MILFSSNKLEKAIADDSLDSWTKAKYMILVIAMYSLKNSFYWFAPSFGPETPLPYYAAAFASWLLGIVITFHGGKKCFKTNETSDGKNYVERLAVLYVPLTFRFIPIFFFFLAIMAFIVACLLPIDKETQYLLFPYLLLPLTLFLIWLFFVLLNRSFERLGELIRERNTSS